MGTCEDAADLVKYGAEAEGLVEQHVHTVPWVNELENLRRRIIDFTTIGYNRLRQKQTDGVCEEEGI